MLLRHARAVAASRVEPADSLDYFPTPPWATRALFEHVLGKRGWRDLIVDEPACGEGHMAYALEDYFGTVRASDVFGYGYSEIRDFLKPGPWMAPAPDWIITNPPFADRALAFMVRALSVARAGVAMFVGSRYLEGVDRYHDVYLPHPPAIVAHFVERVPLHKGRWLPGGDTATAYSWIVWRLDRPVRRTDTIWIPPVCRRSLCYLRDIERFGVFE